LETILSIALRNGNTQAKTPRAMDMKAPETPLVLDRARGDFYQRTGVTEGVFPLYRRSFFVGGSCIDARAVTWALCILGN
jgi:hypothetical protein